MIFNVTIGFTQSPVEATVIQSAFPAGAGWAQYAPNCWLIAAEGTASAKDIADQIRSVCSGNDNIFVTQLHEQNAFGYLQNEFWKWLNDPKSYKPTK
jgi:hypothetical protein